MKQVSKRNRRVVASLMATFFLMHQSLLMPAVATTNITDSSGTPIGPAAGTPNVWDIVPQDHSGSIGYRVYQNFSLDQNDIANLIFSLNDSQAKEGVIVLSRVGLAKLMKLKDLQFIFLPTKIFFISFCM